MKKKLLALMCVAALTLAACGGTSTSVVERTETSTKTETKTETETSTETSVEEAPVVAAEGSLLTGVGTYATIDGSKDASAEGDGVCEGYTTVAAVLVDENGVVVDCKIDIAQTKVNFDTTGKLTTDINSEVKSKQELGDDYGMKKASAIGKEWWEQANAFAAWTVGKTAADISGMALSEGRAADEDLAASVSVHVTNFQAAVVEAINNAQSLGANAGDKLGLGLSTKISGSKDASEEGDGLAECYTTISVVTVNGGVITSSILDAAQVKINFSTAGAITSDLSTEVKSKNELGEAYGMKKASAIGKEWNEQAAAYAAYTVGKTVAEVDGTAMEEGRAADADLAASVSVHITDFNKAIDKAVASAN
jgi:hypothetical protein